MGYQIPTLDELAKLAIRLKDHYQKKDNQERLNFITFVNKLVSDQTFMQSPDAAKILLGAYTFELEYIANTYKVRSPENSRLYDLIKQGLKISKDNVMSNERRLISLSAFYNYIKDEASPELMKSTTWVTKEALRTIVLNTLRTLVGKQMQQINYLLSCHPTFKQLHKNMDETEKRYSARGNSGGFFSTDANLVRAKFLDLINQSCEFLPKVDEEDIDPKLEFDQAYQIRMGAYVFVMKMIEDGYKVRSPENSFLYTMCQKAINCKSTKDINIDDKMLWLSMLSSHITNLTTHHKEDFLSEKQKLGFKNLDYYLTQYQGEIHTLLANYHNEKMSPGYVHGNMTLATSGIAQYGINALIRNTAGDVIPNPAGMAIDSAAGMTGFAVFGPGGALVASSLSRMVRTHIIPLAIAGLFAGALEKVGTCLGETATGMIIMPFSLTGKGLKAIIDWYTTVEFDKNGLRKDEEWIEALRSLPDDVFAMENKAILDSNYGVKTAPVLA